VRRRALFILVLLLAAAGRPVFAWASTLGTLTIQSLTTYAAASTVPTSTCNGTDDFDSWVDGANPTTRHGGATTLRVNSNRPSYALLQFTPCAPANAAIVSATMSLYVNTANKTRVHDVYAITSAWANNVTFATQPSIAGTASASATTAPVGGTTTWDLTADVQSMVNGGLNDGWEIQDNGSGNGNVLYDSLQGTNLPDLSIVYYP
jgi:hypothetical protein